ncbi:MULTISPECIES: MFS transporter [unclassified Oceanispirochaeta]|uniref:MFS transporter n=1 Tax=unclassified Oceanispirochaeta TaxID=2635722 RepID=UPI000E0980B8|nr:MULTISPECIES: MFS transporter [unclassified Oceanispirochaeta]MBF9018235.1 MFS transporter [Oceanispirochaeta sp. M2]NPD74726.1 MFS transporter [Oceanispirochaeta sp. M1]RDG29451.1 MFS transporter [Oceanispirochaeta sp. M1]
MEKEEKDFDLKNVVLISLAHLIHDTYSAFLAPILPLLIGKLGISIFQAGLLDISRKVPSLFNPFIGILADKIYVRYFIILAPVVTTLSMSLIGLSPNYIFLLILVFVSGIASAFFHVPSPVLIKSFSHKQVGRGMSFYMLGGEFARTLGPLVILGAVSLWGLEGTYKLIPFGFLASFILYFKLRNITVKKNQNELVSRGKKETLTNLLPFFISVGGIIFFRMAIKSALTIYLPVYLTSKGYSLWIAGVSLSALQFSGAVGTYFAGSLSDRIGREKVLMYVSIINPILMFLLVTFKGAFLVPILIVSGFFLFASGPVLLALVHDIDTKYSSMVNGMYMTVSFVSGSLMTLIVGISADKLGMELTYKIAAYVSLGAIPFVLFLKAKKKKEIKPSLSF